MAKRIKEQINYGGRSERMDPSLERKLKDPEGLYAKNPALKKGTEDVQRLVSSRFGKVADKLREVTGNRNISSKQVQGMIYQEMMSRLPNIMRIESQHRDELEVTAMGDTAHKFVAGLQSATFTIDFINDWAASQVNETLIW